MSGAAAESYVVNRIMWTDEEDIVLREQVRIHEARDWEKVRLALPGRSAKACQLRWRQYLKPLVENVKPFTAEEDMIIAHYQRIHGNRWSTIAGFLPGRTNNAVKNRWNTVLRSQHAAPYEQHPPRVRCAAAGGQVAARGELTPGCLPLFHLLSRDARGELQGFPQVFPVVDEEDSEVASAAAAKLLDLFPLTPGDANAKATEMSLRPAAIDLFSLTPGDANAKATEMILRPAAIDLFPLTPGDANAKATETSLRPAATVVFDAVPLRAYRRI